MIWVMLIFFFSSVLFLYVAGVAMGVSFYYEVFNFSAPINIIFDKKMMMFVGTILLISSLIFGFSLYYMSVEMNLTYFLLLLFSFVAAMLFLTFGSNFLFLILGWDGLGVVSYLLVVFYYNSSSSNSGLLTFLSNRFGDVFFISLICMSLLFFWCDSSGKFGVFWVSAAMLICFITKSAQFPFSSWLPAAMSAPTPVSSLVHSSTLVTAGVYLLIRFEVSFLLFYILFLISLATLLISGVMAVYECDMKKIIALSTLSQLGFMVSSLCFGMVWFAFFHMLTHAFFKASLFFISGGLIHNMFSSQELRKFFMFNQKNFWFGTLMLMCSLSLVGFPFSIGFFSKDAILDNFGASSYSLMLVFSFYVGVFFTLLYTFRFVKMVFWGMKKIGEM